MAIKSDVETKKEKMVFRSMIELMTEWEQNKELGQKYPCFMDYYEFKTGQNLRHY
jgi:hypothetical protein